MHGGEGGECTEVIRSTGHSLGGRGVTLPSLVICHISEFSIKQRVPTKGTETM